jgi:predicted RNase H-like HicB family nuclease
MRNYKIVAYPVRGADDKIEWCAEFPAIRGCVGGGDTCIEAVTEAFENLEPHLEFMREDGAKIPDEEV